jgi:hypothetical protein
MLSPDFPLISKATTISSGIETILLAYIYIYIYIKSSPATCHGGTWGERRYSSYSFLTSALDGGEWSASRPGRTLPPGKEPPVPIG